MRSRYGDLVRQAAAGDHDCWDQLVEQLSGMIWAVARRQGLAHADAGDVCQTTWLRLLEHLDRIEDPDRVAGWLATTARHESTRLRLRQGRQVLVEDHRDLEPDRSEQAPIDTAVLAEERSAAVHAVYGSLPIRCQDILRLLSADPPLSYRELSEVLDLPGGSIGPTRQRCLETLRRLVSAVA